MGPASTTPRARRPGLSVPNKICRSVAGWRIAPDRRRQKPVVRSGRADHAVHGVGRRRPATRCLVIVECRRGSGCSGWRESGNYFTAKTYTAPPGGTSDICGEHQVQPPLHPGGRQHPNRIGPQRIACRHRKRYRHAVDARKGRVCQRILPVLASKARNRRPAYRRQTARRRPSRAPGPSSPTAGWWSTPACRCRDFHACNSPMWSAPPRCATRWW